MNHKTNRLFLLLVIGFGWNVSGQETRFNPTSGWSPVFKVPEIKIGPIGPRAPAGFERVFAKEVTIFGVKIYATNKTPNSKVKHAAHILAQYLDNDADGKPDNPQVVQCMNDRSAALVMFATERSAEKRERSLHRLIPEQVWDRMILQSLYGEETIPGGAAVGRFDASLEEVLHLITHAGYAFAYPKVFGEKPGTELANAMDKARGGRFFRVPRVYPRQAWYTYDDRSCDYECQATEYFYWGLTSLLGAQDYQGRFQEIRHEWRLNTPEKIKQGDQNLYRLLTHPDYRLPTRLPDGNYRPSSQPN
ncbi:MAG: hypothetical protein VX438_01670 [Planctomycetota bacterium]|nr:hypothetical protein [Planctomycetota bacterium]